MSGVELSRSERMLAAKSYNKTNKQYAQLHWCVKPSLWYNSTNRWKRVKCISQAPYNLTYVYVSWLDARVQPRPGEVSELKTLS